MRAPASKHPRPRANRRGESASRPLPDDALIIVPVRNVVLFPGMVFPLTVGRERSRAAAQEAARLQRPLGILLQSKPEVEEPGPDELHWVGTTANVLRYITAPDGAHHAICQGVKRFRVLQFLEGYPFTAARVQLIETPSKSMRTSRGARSASRQRAAEILQLLPQVPEEMVVRAARRRGTRAARRFHRRADGHQRRGKAGTAGDLRSEGAARQAARAAVASHRGAEGFARNRRAHARSRSTTPTASTCCASRCATIQKELGEGDEGAAEIAELDKAITAAKMPEEVEKQARKELKRLERMPEGAGEYSMVRTYLDWLIELPWAADAEAAIDIARGAAHPRRGPLRAREDQAAHPRVSRGAQAQSVGQEPDPVLRRSARRGQDFARPEHRQGDRPQVRAREPGRRARRGGDPRPPAHLYRLAAGQHHPEPAQGRQRATA